MVSLDVSQYQLRENLDSVFELPLDFLSKPRALSPPPEEKLKRAREARKLQLLRYQQREQERNLQQNGRPGKGGGSSKKVSFYVRERLKDAVMRSDQGEGEKAAKSACW